MQRAAIKFHYKVVAKIWYMKRYFFVFLEGDGIQNWTKMTKIRSKLWYSFVLE